MSPPRRPRDAQRRRVYLAETPVPSSPLRGLPACERFVDQVVGTLWWHARFPDHGLASVPRLRPGNGARQAFYREDADGPSITLPRRYRTKGVVLHELAHWALGIDSDLPHHGRTFARLLLDATREFCGTERARALEASYDEHGVRVGRPARPGPDGRLHYGWDERLRLGRGQVLRVRYGDREPGELVARFDGWEKGASLLRFREPDDEMIRLRAADVWDVVSA